MNLPIILILIMAAALLSACSTQPTEQPSAQEPLVESAPLVPGQPGDSGVTPPLQISTGKKTLKLVRIMDGGACKNTQEGARGEFLIYANLQDIERIKTEKSAEVFQELESQIENFSSIALQEAIEALNLAEDPFSLGQDAAQEKLASQLMKYFIGAVQPAIDKFQKDTTLTVDVRPFPPSFIFYQNGCDLNHINPENE